MIANVMLDTVPATDKDLLIANAHHRFPDVENILVTPSIRLGLSGARVYQVRVKEKRTGLHTRRYFAKIGQSEKLVEEHYGYKTYVDGKMSYAPESWYTMKESDGCLSSFAVGQLHDGKTPIALVDLLPNVYTNLTGICGLIDSVYNNLLQPWKEIAHDEEIDMCKSYEWYLRWERTKTFFEYWLGDQCKDKTFSVNGRTLAMPFQKVWGTSGVRHNFRTFA